MSGPGRSVAVALVLLAAASAPPARASVDAGGGPHPAVMEAAPGLPTHTLYRPQRPAAVPQALPLLVWANGACLNAGNRFQAFLTEIASHGYVVVALGPIVDPADERPDAGGLMRGPPAPGSPAARALAAGQVLGSGRDGDLRPADTTPRQMIDAIDWAEAENRRLGSPLHGRIDTGAVAVMGQSCGGLQAIDAAHDPRVRTLGVWNSGLFSDPARAAAIAAVQVVKADLARLHTPVLYVTGDRSDQAFANADDDVARITQVPVLRAWLEGTGHGGTYRQPRGGAFAEVAVAWLQWQLRGDWVAARQFRGADCGLCIAPGWHLRRWRIEPGATPCLECAPPPTAPR